MNRRSSIQAIARAQARRSGFSLAELLVVVGVISLLIAITLPPLQYARRQAMRTQCSGQLQQFGRALGSLHTETSFYPKYDDGGTPIRYTWIDVLIERRLISPGNGSAVQGVNRTLAESARLAYCPSDLLPDPMNGARNSDLTYPLYRGARGVDYSYGIGVPLSTGGWALPRGYTNENRTRRFVDHDRNISGRVLVADSYDSKIYNMSGNALTSHVWNDPTQYDNTVAWGRHATSADGVAAANVLFQDYHVGTIRYDSMRPQPVNTSLTFVWQPDEPLNVTPNDHIGDMLYPNVGPPSAQSIPPGDVFPNDMLPFWYTNFRGWTLTLKN